MTGLLDLGNGLYIKLYPNPLPGNQLLNVDWSLSALLKQLRVIVRDNTGRELSRHVMDRREGRIRIGGNAGVYHLEFRWVEAGRNEVRVMSVWMGAE